MISINNPETAQKIRSYLSEFYKQNPDKMPSDVIMLGESKKSVFDSEIKFLKGMNSFSIKNNEELNLLQYFDGLNELNIDIELTKDQLDEILKTHSGLEKLRIYKSLKVHYYSFDEYPNIKELKICGQEYLEKIRFTNLKGLEKLEINHNPALTTVYGIELLQKLYSLKLYDNQYLEPNMIQLKNIIESGSTDLVLDSIMYPEFMKLYDLDDPSKPVDFRQRPKLDTFMNNVRWFDLYKYNDYILEEDDFLRLYRDICDYKRDVYISSLKRNAPDKERVLEHYQHALKGYKKIQNITFSTIEYYPAYQKAKKIIDTYIRDTDTDLQKYAILYTWITNNVKYDFRAIDDNTFIHSVEGINLKGLEDVRIQSGVKLGTNTSVNGLLSGECVCEGYTKIMQLLLKMCGIQSHNIINYINYDPKKGHSALAVETPDGIFYSDATNDYDGNYELFIMTEDEFKKNYQINTKVGIQPAKPISIEEKIKLIEFAKNRFLEVDQEKTTNEKKHQF